MLAIYLVHVISFVRSSPSAKFGMVQPSELICSIQGTFNEIGLVNGMDDDALAHVPSELKTSVRDGNV